MKKCSWLLALVLLPALHAEEVLSPNLTAIPSGQGWKGNIAAATLTSKEGAPAISLRSPEDKAMVIWVDNFAFTNGVIEFDCKGQSAPPQSNFVGIAFRVVDAETYDAVYFRPFNFRTADPTHQAHAVQYISLPTYGWKYLRENKTGQYEKAITPAPDGDAWLHARIVIDKPKISVFVNGAKEPSLVVERTLRPHRRLRRPLGQLRRHHRQPKDHAREVAPRAIRRSLAAAPQHRRDRAVAA